MGIQVSKTDCKGCPPEPAVQARGKVRLPVPGSPPGFFAMVDSPQPGPRLAALREVLRAPGSAPEGEGDGILYVGGGRYWPGIAVGCRLIRELGCEMPIEVWYRGSCEAVYPEDVRGLGVELIDADAMSVKLGDNRVPRGNRDYGGWETKGYAFTHTTLSRFLYLDADAYCVSSPCRLFPLLDRRPFVFWADFATQQNTIRWESVLPEVATLGAALPPVQGGQLLIDRRGAWPLIATMNHICQHSDYYWPSPESRLMYGDQDAWRVPMADGAAAWLNLGAAAWRDVAFVCEWEGKPRIVHRCQSKLYGPEFAGKPQENKPYPHLPLEGRVFDLLADVLNKRPLPPSSVFGAIYERNLWTDGSGAGSNEQEAAPYLKIVNALAAERGWASCVDVGCGDGRVARGLRFAEYIGVDCVPGVPVSVVADCYRDLENLPGADVLLAKDVLMHWSNEWVSDWLARLQLLLDAGRWKAAVLTQDRAQLHDGQDTYLGGYRALNPAMQPLNQFDLEEHARYLHKSTLVMESAILSRD